MYNWFVSKPIVDVWEYKLIRDGMKILEGDNHVENIFFGFFVSLTIDFAHNWRNTSPYSPAFVTST